MLKVGHPCSYVCVCNPMLMGKQSLTQSCNKYKALKKKNNITNNINKSHHKTHLETKFFTKNVNIRYICCIKTFFCTWFSILFHIKEIETHGLIYVPHWKDICKTLHFVFSRWSPCADPKNLNIHFLFCSLKAMLSSERETDNTESFYQSLATAQQKKFF